MLSELIVHDLGVIDELALVLGPGMTALTGETGAGKTLLVGAIDLLLGGRADAGLVRPGAEEARVEGRFVVGDVETVLTRVVPREGRSRAYVDGRAATVAELTAAGAALVDVHGQHGNQSLVAARTQRAALDRFAGTDLAPLRAARGRLAELDAALEALGGDERARARQVDLLRFQVAELDAAQLDDPDEEARLEALEDELADAGAHRGAGLAAADALLDDGGAADALAAAAAALAARAPYAGPAARLDALVAEARDLGHDLRELGESIAEDPARLDEVQARRSLLRDLRRKYGAVLAEVIEFRDRSRAELEELGSVEARAEALGAERARVVEQLAVEAARVAAVRRAAAGPLARAVEGHLHDLALGRARFAVEVGADDPGDDVTFLLAPNPGEPAQPVARAASGGELARTMLALRLVVTQAPPTLVFDEVDAGVGGRAALAVGRALAALGSPEVQVLVVTHLAQVAAFADAQVVVAKGEAGGRTTTSARPVRHAERVEELSRMLSGLSDSETGREHAGELLRAAAALRADTGSGPGTGPGAGSLSAGSGGSGRRTS